MIFAKNIKTLDGLVTREEEFYINRSFPYIDVLSDGIFGTYIKPIMLSRDMDKIVRFDLREQLRGITNKYEQELVKKTGRSRPQQTV